MKAIVCELCGGNDLVKQDGYFVCQNCGTKYTLEEARKIVLEGTVKIDNSDKLDNYYKLARSAKDEDDPANAKKYYELILEEDPLSWEAKLYANYYTAKQCKVAEALFECRKLEKIIPSVLKMLKDNNYGEADTGKYLGEAVIKLHELTMLFALGGSEDAALESIDLNLVIGDSIEEIFPEYADKYAVTFWKSAVITLVGKYVTGDAGSVDRKVDKILRSIHKYDQAYQAPEGKIKRHSADSPNRVAAKIVKVGHETYVSSPVGPEKIFQYGCDQVGHIGAEVEFKNISGSSIKYVTVGITPYNRVGDVAPCTVTGTETYGINFTGPIPVGSKRSGYVDGIWYNNAITNAIIEYVDVTYMNDKTERFMESDLSSFNQTSGSVRQSNGNKGATENNNLNSKKIETKKPETENKLKRMVSNKNGIKIGISVVLGVAALVALVLILGHVEKGNKYNEANACYESGDYSSAIQIWSELGEYSDSSERIADCYYNIALGYAKAGDYSNALKNLETVPYSEECEKLRLFCESAQEISNLNDGNPHNIEAIYKNINAFAGMVSVDTLLKNDVISTMKSMDGTWYDSTHEDWKYIIKDGWMEYHNGADVYYHSMYYLDGQYYIGGPPAEKGDSYSLITEYSGVGDNLFFEYSYIAAISSASTDGFIRQ